MNPSFSVLRMGLLICLCAFSLTASAQNKKGETYFDHENIAEDEKTWQEKTPALPAYPDLNKLQPFYAGPATTLEFSIDPASLQIGEDEVVRYTLVVKSRQGALNISYEGLRCATLERKRYAIGHNSDKSWSPVNKPVWKRIEYADVNRHYIALGTEYFCQQKTLTSRNPKDLLLNLKNSRNF